MSNRVRVKVRAGHDLFLSPVIFKRGDGWNLIAWPGDFLDHEDMWCNVKTWLDGGPSPYPRQLGTFRL